MRITAAAAISGGRQAGFASRALRVDHDELLLEPPTFLEIFADRLLRRGLTFD